MIPSAALYGAAWVARAWLPRTLRKTGEAPVDPRTLARSVTAFARVVVCSGSYVLCDVKVMEGRENVGVKVRLV